MVGVLALLLKCCKSPATARHLSVILNNERLCYGINQALSSWTLTCLANSNFKQPGNMGWSSCLATPVMFVYVQEGTHYMIVPMPYGFIEMMSFRWR